MFRISLVLAAACLATGCASIVNGQNQSISVTTVNKGVDVAGARCKLSNDKGIWYITTPGSLLVHRSFNDLSVDCTLDGAEPGTAMVKSSTKAMAFGNILFGGIIGAGVDMSTGAAYDYPAIINVELGKVVNLSPQPTAEKTKEVDPASIVARQDPFAPPKR